MIPLMTDAISEISECLRELARRRPSETFYALAIDAGYLCLNSQEAFNETRQQYFVNWANDNAPLSAEAVDEDDLADFLRRNPEASIEHYLDRENAGRSERRAVGNPYEDPESAASRSLRDRPGNWRYTELVECVPDDDVFEHYDLEDDAQSESSYQRAVAGILRDLQAQRSVVFAGLNLSPDFRMFAPEHGY